MKVNNKWDVFEFNDLILDFFEKSQTTSKPKFMPPRTSVSERVYAKVHLRADTNPRKYLRDDYDILTYFGDLGGLMDFVMLFGWAVSTLFV